MDYRSFLNSFWQVGSVAKILFFQAFSLYLISLAVGLLAMAIGVRGCAPRPDYLDFYLWIVLTSGLVVGIISLHPIVFPHVSTDDLSNEIRFSIIGKRYPFFSTHPYYIWLDILLLIPAGIVFWNGQIDGLCEFNLYRVQGIAAIVIALSFPAIRLLCWFGLKRQIEATVISGIWMPIAWGALLFLPVVLFFSIGYSRRNIISRLNTQLVTAENFRGGLDQHKEFTDKIVHIRGKVIRGIGKCGLWGKKDRTDYPYGTVVLDMGKKNGYVIVQAKTPSDVLKLEAESMNKMGADMDAFGTLYKLPNPDKKMICGIEKYIDYPPKGGLALLEMELPMK